ncbi:MAG: signal peptidase I [Rhizomicrobium sp.]
MTFVGRPRKRPHHVRRRPRKADRRTARRAETVEPPAPPPEPEPVAPPAKPSESWVETVKTIVYALLIALVIRTFLFQPFNIPSGSMEATLLIGDYLFVEKFSYGYSRNSFPFSFPPFAGRVFGSPPTQGDVVVFKMPNPASDHYMEDYIKRVIGMPGDKVQMIDGVLYLNDKAVPKERVADYVERDEFGLVHNVPQFKETLPSGKSYLVLDRDTTAFDNTQPYVVPKGEYFMMATTATIPTTAAAMWATFRPKTLSGARNCASSPSMTPPSGTNLGPGPERSASAGCSPSSTDLEDRLGHRFADPGLLKRALTHSSANAIVSNERLEFLGDRVLGLVIAEDLHKRYPDDAEGALALKLNALVREEACARAAEAAGLADSLILAKSESLSGGRRKGAILAGACEAVIAALYQDGGPRNRAPLHRVLLGADDRDPQPRHARSQDDAPGMGAGAARQFRRAGLCSGEARRPRPRAAFRGRGPCRRPRPADRRRPLQARSGTGRGEEDAGES